MTFLINKKIKLIVIIIIFLQLFYISNKRLDFEIQILKKSFLPEYGAQFIMSNDILELKEVSKKLKLNEFNISKSLRNNVFFYQRSIEYLYPIKINNNLKNIFYANSEMTPINCIEINKYKYLKLIKC